MVVNFAIFFKHAISAIAVKRLNKKGIYFFNKNKKSACLSATALFL